MSESILPVGVAQISPVWLDKSATLAKMLAVAGQAAARSCKLLVFGEGLLPGYPFWIEHTDGARFNSELQKDMYALYVREAVSIEDGDLKELCQSARAHSMAIYAGCIERQGHSVFCSLVYIGPDGQVGSVHRKLMPTYEERLVWAQGDGHGLRVHKIGAFTAGGLNCWENWMPLARAALYNQGEDLHISVWPGSLHNTHDITRFIARESRSYVISACGLLPVSAIPGNLPVSDTLASLNQEYLANGGSCIAGPDGEWILEPVVGQEGLFTADLNHSAIRRERLLFDPAGHYSRKDVLSLQVNRQRRGDRDKTGS